MAGRHRDERGGTHHEPRRRERGSGRAYIGDYREGDPRERLRRARDMEPYAGEFVGDYRGGHGQRRHRTSAEGGGGLGFGGDLEGIHPRALTDVPETKARGGQRGRGPRGYTRSDERVLEEVNDALTEDDELDASDIEVKVSGGEVTLDGRVACREDKRHAEDIAERVSGVRHVQNNLRLRQPVGEK